MCTRSSVFAVFWKYLHRITDDDDDHDDEEQRFVVHLIVLSYQSCKNSFRKFAALYSHVVIF